MKIKTEKRGINRKLAVSNHQCDFVCCEVVDWGDNRLGGYL
jgi:hypothetical protein